MTDPTAPIRAGSTAYHLRPRSGWLNDPNGMVHHDGRWHVFFQHNPDGPRHHRIAWGHASSDDLVTWRDHPVAFVPTPGGPDSFGCWTGVFVPGLERPAVVYSGVTGSDLGSTVCLRRAEDDTLDAWGDPMVVATTPEEDDIAVMRDPFVFEHHGRRFAILGAGLTDGTPAILLYQCDDIEDWDYLGVWLTGADPVLADAAPADVWECPQLAVTEDGRAALVLSLHDGGVLGEVVACAGTLADEAGLPRLRPESLHVLDGGADFYAPQLATDEGEGWWVLGWVREDDQDPAVADHAGCMTLPRRLLLDDRGPRLVLDPSVPAGLELGSAGRESGPLLGQLSVEVDGEGAVLAHEKLGERLLDPGSRVFVDGAVLEVYPPDGAPATFRHPESWVLRGAASVSEVLTSSRAPRAGTGGRRAEG